MFDYIYQWLQNLAFYMILVMAVIHMLPDNNYVKYIRFFCGVILVVLLAAPVMKLLGTEQAFRNIYESAEYGQTKKEMERAAELFKGTSDSFLEGLADYGMYEEDSSGTEEGGVD